MSQRKRILVAPLNWGLGHATRCIPIIQELQRQGAEVFIASDGRPLELLKQEFPDLPAFSLPGYNISYRSDKLIQSLIWQTPKMVRAAILERRQVARLVRELGIDGIISDNRFGCHSRQARCVFMTHQLFVKIGNRWLDGVVQWINFQFIRAFDECWIPDVEGEPNLSGELSHLPGELSKLGGNFKLPSNFSLLPKLGDNFKLPPNFILRFIGAISRMEKRPAAKKYDLIAVLSGPEPQRTNLERLLLEQAENLPHRILVLQGKPEQHAHFFLGKNIEVISHLPSKSLNEAILASDLFLGRSGYTSIMDLAKLGKPAVFIPTPGQTEQVYLAEHFHRQGTFLMQTQAEFDLKKALAEAAGYTGLSADFFDEQALYEAVAKFLASSLSR